MFRYARHTTDLKPMLEFYTKIAGLELLLAFTDHDGYNGLILGHPDAGWEIEFTTSNLKPLSKPDEDDYLVFYIHSEVELQALKRALADAMIPAQHAKNPYWNDHGIVVHDPGGFNVIFAYREIRLNAPDDLTQLVLQNGIQTWNDFLDHVRHLPYGRNLNRKDLSLVLSEKKGTCSSKHALIKTIAERNGIRHVKLMIGMYKMNSMNTPKTGKLLSRHGIDYLPEAHCYVMMNNRRFDLTSAESDIGNLMNDVIEEIEIEASQVDEFKVAYHQQFMQDRMIAQNINMNFDEIWSIREQCIEAMSSSVSTST